MTFTTRYATLEDVLQNTKANGTCMEWQGGVNRDGYGACAVYGLFTSQLVHREVFLQVHGYKPPVVRHTCDNATCINPEHLVGGTAKDNEADKLTRKRHARGAKNGNARLTLEQALTLRMYRAENGLTYKELAAIFNVSRATVWRVLAEKNWKSNANN